MPLREGLEDDLRRRFALPPERDRGAADVLGLQNNGAVLAAENRLATPGTVRKMLWFVAAR